MTGVLRVIDPGLHATVQDSGRLGWRRFGVSVSGAMDPPALALANILAGNPPDGAAVEFAQTGGTWQIDTESCRIAVTGGSFSVSADGAPLAPWHSHTLRRGQRLTIGGARDAMWGYLAVAGGFAIAAQLGSRATHVRSGIGGRRIEAGDALPLGLERAPAGREHFVPPLRWTPGPIRVVLGPQADYFAPETIAAFLAATWRVGHRGDRMGVWLDGPPIAHARGFNLVSDGLVAGCIQVPGSGQPVVLLMDCQTAGGYPKLATVITPDLPRLAQSRSGTRLRFAAIDVEAAQQLYRAYHAVFATPTRALRVAPGPPPWESWFGG